MVGSLAFLAVQSARLTKDWGLAVSGSSRRRLSTAWVAGGRPMQCLVGLRAPCPQSGLWQNRVCPQSSQYSECR